MNRIKEMRSAKGWSSAYLAEMVGTAQSTIHRLETGKRRLTVEWMMILSRALECAPHDLLDHISDEALAEVVRIAGGSHLSNYLATYRVNVSRLDQLGIYPGTSLVVDEGVNAVAELETADIVVLSTISGQNRSTPILIARQFVKPSLFVTNASGSNSAVHFDNDPQKLNIVGRVVKSVLPLRASDPSSPRLR